MKTLVMVVVLSALVVPAAAEPVTYTYQVTSGTITVHVEPNDVVDPNPLVGPIGGTFSVTFYDDDGSIGESDTFVLAGADLWNAQNETADVYVFGCTGYLSAEVGGLHISEFSTVTPGHLASDGTGSVETDVYGGGTFYANVRYLYVGWVAAGAWSDEVETYCLDFDFIDGVPVSVSMTGGFTYELVILDILGPGPDFGQDVEIGAVLVPEPAVCGCLTLLIGVAGARLRRRR